MQKFSPERNFWKQKSISWKLKNILDWEIFATCLLSANDYIENWKNAFSNERASEWVSEWEMENRVETSVSRKCEQIKNRF